MPAVGGGDERQFCEVAITQCCYILVYLCAF